MPQFPREISKWLEILYIIYKKYTDNRWFTRVVNKLVPSQLYLQSDATYRNESVVSNYKDLFFFTKDSRRVLQKWYLINDVHIIQFNIYDKN